MSAATFIACAVWGLAIAGALILLFGGGRNRP